MCNNEFSEELKTMIHKKSIGYIKTRSIYRIIHFKKLMLSIILKYL